MAIETRAPEAPPEEGLLASLHRVARAALRLVATRLEIFSTEFTEERFNLTKLAIGALIVLFCLQLGLVLGAVFLVLAIGSEHRVAAVGIASLVMLLGAAGVALWLRQWLRSRPPWFAETVRELKKDRDTLRGDE